MEVGVNIFQLFLVFLKIGTFSFGGGHAMIPLIEKELVKKRKWITEDTMKYMIAISETTPGPVAINMATFVGYRLKRLWGAFIATFGVIFSPVLIIIIIGFVLTSLLDNTYFNVVLQGFRLGAIVLISHSVIIIFKRTTKSFFGFLLIILGFTISLLTKANALVVMIILLAYLVIESIMIIPHENRMPFLSKIKVVKGKERAKPKRTNKKILIFIFMIVGVLSLLYGLVFIAGAKPGLNILRDSGIFFLVSLFTIGGGHAMIPMMESFLVHFKVIPYDILLNLAAIAESTPGPFSVNMATVVGLFEGGKMAILGGVLTSISIILPSFIIIVFVARHFDRFIQNKVIRRTLGYLLALVVGLLMTVVFEAGKRDLYISKQFQYKEAIILGVLYFMSFARIRGREMNHIFILFFGAIFTSILYLL